MYRGTAIICGSITGLVIGIARLSNKKLIEELKKKFTKKKLKNYSAISINQESISQDATFLGEYFDNITKKVANIQTLYQILVMVYLKFKTSEKTNEYLYESTSRYDDYKFSENEYSNLITPDFGSASYQKRSF